MTESLAILCRYHYDPLDRLIASGIRTRAEHQLFYRGKWLAGESRGGVFHAFLHADDRPVAQFIHSGKAMDATLLATDAPGSVLHALTRGQRQAQAYAVYGYHPPGGGLDSLLGFNSERRDPVTGHYLLGQGYRAYNSVLMRFNSPDSLSPFGLGGLNAYGYCNGDPLNAYDPTGHAPQYPIWRVAHVYGKTKVKALMVRIKNFQTLDDVRDFLGEPHATPVSSRSYAAASSTQAHAGPSSASVSRPGKHALHHSGVLPSEAVYRYRQRINKLRHSRALKGRARANFRSSKKTYKVLVRAKEDVAVLIRHYEAVRSIENVRLEALERHRQLASELPEIIRRYRDDVHKQFGRHPD